MPKIRRWFRVSHDINSDPEVWEMTDRFGDRTLRVWMELLSIADRNEGEIKGERKYLQVVLSSKLRTTFAKVSSVFDYALEKGWLEFDGTLRVSNYAKYNGSREHDKIPTGETISSPPRLDITLHDVTVKQEATLLPPSQENLVSAAPAKWTPEDHWLKEFLDTQILVDAPREAFDDPKWWGNVAETVNGLNLPFLNTEFAKMGAWLMENKSQRPIKAAGWKRFTRGWLERAANYNRRNANGNQAKWR